ncbi:hypothetical protein D3C72_2511540 [compost metagenome]
MLAVSTIFLLRAYSDCTNFPNASGVPLPGNAPCSASLARTPSSCSTAFSSWLSRATTAGGVFAGAKMPVQLTMS